MPRWIYLIFLTLLKVARIWNSAAVPVSVHAMHARPFGRPADQMISCDNSHAESTRFLQSEGFATISILSRPDFAFSGKCRDGHNLRTYMLLGTQIIASICVEQPLLANSVFSSCDDSIHFELPIRRVAKVKDGQASSFS